MQYHKFVLDYGCGHGGVADLFSIFGSRVSACDRFERMLVMGSDLSSTKKINFFKDDMFATQLEQNAYHFINMRAFPAIDHYQLCEATKKFLETLLGSLNKNGVLLYTVVSHSNPKLLYKFEEMIRFFSSVGTVVLAHGFACNMAFYVSKKDTLSPQQYAAKFPYKFDSSCVPLPQQLSHLVSWIRFCELTGQATPNTIQATAQKIDENVGNTYSRAYLCCVKSTGWRPALI